MMDAPVLFPGRCMTCGRSKGKMVDTQIDDPAIGNVYVCVDVCVPSFAALAGFVPAEALAEAQEKLAAANEAVVELEGQIAELVPVRDAVALAARRFGDVEADDEPVMPKARSRRAA